MDRPHKGSKEVQLAENGLKFIERPPVYLNQSFRELAFNILQCIIRYGVKIDEKDQEHFDVEEAGMRAKQFAEVALQRLARMYPDDIPQYCRELVR